VEIFDRKGQRSVNVIIQIGYRKSMNRRRDGQLIRALINDIECSWKDDCGKYLTSKMDSAKGILWYLWKGNVDVGDTIRISVATSIIKIGKDEERTFDSLYYVDSDAPLREIIIPGIGYKKYPLIKGHVREMASVSEADKRIAAIDEFLRGDFD